MIDRPHHTASSSRRARALVAGAFATAMVGTSGAVAMRSVVAATPPSTVPTADESGDGWFDDADTPVPTVDSTLGATTTTTTPAPTTAAAPVTEPPNTEAPAAEAPPEETLAPVEEPAPVEEAPATDPAPAVDAVDAVVEEPPATDPPATDPPVTAARKPTRSPRTTACTGSTC